MEIIAVANTNQLPRGDLLHVHSSDEQEVERALIASAVKRGLQLLGTVYRWGKVDYYAPVLKAADA